MRHQEGGAAPGTAFRRGIRRGISKAFGQGGSGTQTVRAATGERA